MKQILLATTNPGKIMTFKKILAKLGYEGVSFADLGLELEEPDETQLTAEEDSFDNIIIHNSTNMYCPAERYKCQISETERRTVGETRKKQKPDAETI